MSGKGREEWLKEQGYYPDPPAPRPDPLDPETLAALSEPNPSQDDVEWAEFELEVMSDQMNRHIIENWTDHARRFGLYDLYGTPEQNPRFHLALQNRVVQDAEEGKFKLISGQDARGKIINWFGAIQHAKRIAPEVEKEAPLEVVPDGKLVDDYIREERQPIFQKQARRGYAGIGKSASQNERGAAGIGLSDGQKGAK